MKILCPIVCAIACIFIVIGCGLALIGYWAINWSRESAVKPNQGEPMEMDKEKL